MCSLKKRIILHISELRERTSALRRNATRRAATAPLPRRRASNEPTTRRRYFDSARENAEKNCSEKSSSPNSRIFMQIRVVAAALAFSPPARLFAFAFVVLTRVASHHVVPSPSPSSILCLSAGPCERLGISIRRRVSTAFFRMPRGRSEADETCGSNGIFFYDFSRFFDAGREMRSLPVRMLNRTYFECELSFTTTAQSERHGSGSLRRTCAHAKEIFT